MFMKRALLFIMLAAVYGCVGIPQNVQPVQDFQLERYLGTWYEIARLDHSFERGLSKITATYSLRDDGGVKVVNRGYNAKKQQWDEAEGKAYFVLDPSIGRLKVSFFGPFYGGYNVFVLDEENYQYAMVCGPDLTYLWILARSPALDNSIVEQLVAHAKSKGFATEELIFVDH